MSEFAWLIEAPGHNHLAYRYLGKHEFYWTDDPNKALRFYSSQQADGVMMALREMFPPLFGFALTLGDARVIEHGWSDLPSPPTQPEGPRQDTNTSTRPETVEACREFLVQQNKFLMDGKWEKVSDEP
jgi:hypothetical protein